MMTMFAPRQRYVRFDKEQLSFVMPTNWRSKK